MPIYTTAATGAQDGYNLNLGPWIDGTPTLLFGVNYRAGLQFLVHNTFNAAGQILDPALIYPSFDLTLTASTPPIAGTAIPAVAFVPEIAPAPYSNALSPGLRNEQGVIITSVTTATQVTITIPTLDMLQYIRHSGWNGIISLTVTVLGLGTPFHFHSNDAADTSLAPSIDTGTETPFFTGIEGHGVERGRPVRDMKTGLPAHAPDLTEDGYLPGIWTVPSQWDPADPRDERPTELPDHEGVWEDDVPAR